MIINIKKILTEDSELLQSVRNELENSLSSANARGTEIEKLTKTPSPHISDKPLKTDEEGNIEIEESEQVHHEHTHDEHAAYLKILRKLKRLREKDNPEITSIYESVILTKNRFLGKEVQVNKSAAKELSKEGLANTDAGSRAVQNSPINSLMNTSDAANGIIKPKRALEESTNADFGKVHTRSTEGTPLVNSQSTQAAINEKGVAERSKDKKIVAGVTEANPAHLINSRSKDGLTVLRDMQRGK